MSNFRSLEVWNFSCEFAGRIYELTRFWKDFGLRDQITRSAVSIASNIAEGAERDSDKDFLRFLKISKASCAECRTQAKIANMIGILNRSDYETVEKEADKLSRQIHCLMRYLKTRKSKQ